jgi:hypothetical protein
MRADIIRERIDRFVLDELLMAVATPTVEEWERLDRKHTRFGWAPPVKRDGEIVIAYQPDLIDEWTAHLDDEDFDTILETIEFLIAMQAHYLDAAPAMTEDQRVSQAESDLYDEAGRGLEYLSIVQMEAVQ